MRLLILYKDRVLEESGGEDNDAGQARVQDTREKKRAVNHHSYMNSVRMEIKKDKINGNIL